MTIRPVIRLKAGDDRSVRVAVQDASGSARDVTGETIEFRAAASLSSGASLISKTDGNGVEVIDASLGLIDIVFVPDDTVDAPGYLLWEIRITDASGEVITLDFGTADDPATYGLLKIEQSLLRAG